MFHLSLYPRSDLVQLFFWEPVTHSWLEMQQQYIDSIEETQYFTFTGLLQVHWFLRYSWGILLEVKYITPCMVLCQVIFLISSSCILHSHQSDPLISYSSVPHPQSIGDRAFSFAIPWLWNSWSLSGRSSLKLSLLNPILRLSFMQLQVHCPNHCIQTLFWVGNDWGRDPIYNIDK